MKYVSTLLVFFLMKIEADPVPQILNFFPDADYDLRKITWGHAINTKALLEDAINDSYMMLEADVSKGHLENETEPSRLIPIMAHPPHTTSDISLQMWIDAVIAANEAGQKIGVKLDFKDLDIVLTSLEILRKKEDMLTFPLWLNADILPGPGGKRTPVDADIFLSLCTEFFPEATLSLGWTTGIEEGGQDQIYTTDMMYEMVEALDRNNVDQPLTFPVRAAFVGASLDALESLVLDKPYSTFTVWTSPSDKVDLPSLAKIQLGFGTHNVFFDLPDDMKLFLLQEEQRLLEKGKGNADADADADADASGAADPSRLLTMGLLGSLISVFVVYFTGLWNVYDESSPFGGKRSGVS